MLKSHGMIGIVSGVISIVLGAGAAQADPTTITIGATHTLKAPLQAILPMFEQEYGATVKVVYGPSQALRRSIEKGAAIDVFLPGAAIELDKLHQKGLTLNGGPRIYAQSPLVLITSAASPATAISFHDVFPSRPIRLAVADPKVSALGTITAGALTRLDPLYKNHLQLLPAEHTEEILKSVRSGKADAGIIYRVDAINGGQVRIIEQVPGEADVRFGAAMVWTCPETSRDTAQQFIDFLTSTRIQKLLVHYGFDPLSLKKPAVQPAVQVRSIEE